MRPVSYFILAFAATILAFPENVFGQPVNEQWNPIVTASNLARSGTTTAMPIKFYGFGPIENETQKNIQEDCEILNHLISESLTLTNHRQTLGVNVFQTFGRNSAMYIQGTGLILNYNVGIPVAPGPERTDLIAQASAKPEAKSDWDKARDALNSRATSSSDVRQDFLTARVNQFQPSPTYDSDQVEQLIAELKKALSLAGNCSGLNRNDTITVYIHGPASLNGKQSVIACRVNMEDAGDSGEISKVDLKQYNETVNQPARGYLHLQNLNRPGPVRNGK